MRTETKTRQEVSAPSQPQETDTASSSTGLDGVIVAARGQQIAAQKNHRRHSCRVAAANVDLADGRLAQIPHPKGAVLAAGHDRAGLRAHRHV